ncbi:MAG: hypothetical protein ACR2KW_09980 [Rubrobacter sp.]
MTLGKISPHQPFEDHHAVDAKGSGLSFSQMLAAGLASTGAAVVTSRFGVAGTIIGAALTTMIITGGSAILKSYLETLAGHAKSVPQRINTGRTRANRARAGRTGSTATVNRDPLPDSEGMKVYGRGENGGGRQGFSGKLRSSFGWFSNLSTSRKSGILLGAAVPAVIAFIVAMSAITSVEVASGRTLSCLTSGTCQTEIGASGATSNTTFGTVASQASGSSGGSSQPAESQLDSPSLAPEQNPSGVQSESDDDSGFFGQPSSGGGSDGSGVPSDPSGAGVPSGTGQPPVVAPSDPSGGAVQEAPVEEAVPQQATPPVVEPAPAQ